MSDTKTTKEFCFGNKVLFYSEHNLITEASESIKEQHRIECIFRLIQTIFCRQKDKHCLTSERTMYNLLSEKEKAVFHDHLWVVLKIKDGFQLSELGENEIIDDLLEIVENHSVKTYELVQEEADFDTIVTMIIRNDRIVKPQ